MNVGDGTDRPPVIALDPALRVKIDVRRLDPRYTEADVRDFVRDEFDLDLMIREAQRVFNLVKERFFMP